ncbi:MAG: molybdopterin synthase catalytic subunit MoaE [Proteobacteria bacterium]|nr:molybdopterin synthase catalytic subunit MoaE [Pseudomonadota bacterium]MDA1302150.1 molybdopterin synthase catalytic subunit MoaE [Pseudomonadota bacterium]
MNRRVLVQADAFDAGAEITRLRESSAEVGGIATFLGVVRDINEDDTVSGLYLEHYPGMTESQIDDIITEAASRWQVLAATVIHRVGALAPNDEIVFVGVGSRHRGDAFDACEFIMDFLKTRAAFWKKEQTTDGSRWLTTRASDVDAASRWDA